jgi:Protein of unknown function (DUF1573)
MRTTLLVLAICLIAAARAHAGLSWEQTQIELRPKPGDAAAVASFKYKNTGDKSVRFLSVRSSCGCTTASLKKDDVAPGESGEINATFKIGDRTGTQEKKVWIETDDPAQPQAELVLRAIIPQLLELRPSFVYWENNEPVKPKTITVKAAKELNALSLKVSSSSSDFITRVSSSRPNEFKIEVQPRDTKHPATSSLVIQPDSGGAAVYATAKVLNLATSAE